MAPLVQLGDNGLVTGCVLVGILVVTSRCVLGLAVYVS